MPKITFCWLPPDSVPASCSGVSALMRRKSTISLTSAASLRLLRKPLSVKRRMTESVRFSRTLLVSSSPWPRRSSGTSAMPSRPISAARGLPIETGLPQSSMLPLALAAPNSAWNSSRWPCPCRPPTPSTSPSRRAKLDALQAAAARKVADLQRDAVGRRRDALGIEPVEMAADHLGDDLVVGDRVRLMRGDGAAVAEDGQAVGDGAHLRHAVRDEDDELALAGELPRQLEQPFRLAGRQRRGRLVEDEDARVLGEPLGDLDDLPLGQRQAPHFLVRAQRRKAYLPSSSSVLRRSAARSTVLSAVSGSWRNQMFCSTVRSGISDSSWNTAAMPRPARRPDWQGESPRRRPGSCRRHGARRRRGSG